MAATLWLQLYAAGLEKVAVHLCIIMVMVWTAVLHSYNIIEILTTLISKLSQRQLFLWNSGKCSQRACICVYIMFMLCMVIFLQRVQFATLQCHIAVSQLCTAAYEMAVVLDAQNWVQWM